MTGSTLYAYLRSLDHLGYSDRVKVLIREFKYLGKTGAFVFLHSVNEAHPDWEER